MVESPVMQGTKRKSIFDFIRSAFMLNRNDVRSIEQIQLDTANTTAMTVSTQNICPKTCVTNFPVYSLQNLPTFFRLDVLKIEVHGFLA